ncbi:hypothetical protein [Pseudomonas lundensis]|uniref:hypothetical protein n=1 Tax=Pseudomonas lundensis TaxID=86185 RepID=UPI00385BDA9F
MSESKFTPGPWAVINRTGVFSELGAESGDGAKADPTDGWTIADCSAGCTLLNGDYVELGFAVQQANAKLIAAAPELLESLSNLMGLAKLGAARLDKYHAALADAEAVIAKATA